MAVSTRITVAKMMECYSSIIAVLLVLLLLPLSSVSSFQQLQLRLQLQHPNVFKISTDNKSRLTRTTAYSSSLSSSDDACQEDDRRDGCSNKNRREILIETMTKAAAFTAAAASVSITASQSPLPASAAADTTTTTKDLNELRIQIEMALKQINNIPDLIQNEKWDSIRAILIEHPIYDCWNKNTPMLKSYADALGATPTGDELSALEQREELISHLRYLDMAVYNNVFNPISSEGTNGATKALIDSYYNDPIREYKASKSALEELIKLSE